MCGEAAICTVMWRMGGGMQERDAGGRVKASFSHPSICISPLLQTMLCKTVVRSQGNEINLGFSCTKS